MAVKILKSLLESMFPKSILLSRRELLGNTIALTFDDGPHSKNTEKILGILKKEGVKATFFLLGEGIERYPELAKKIKENGHQLGNHSFSHKKIKEEGFKKYIEGIEKTKTLLLEKAGSNGNFFRPPYGEITPGLIVYAMRNNMKIIHWTFDSTDSLESSPAKIKEFLKQAEIKKGDVILFHEDYSHTPELLPDFIADLKKRGFGFRTVSELLRV